VHCCPGAKGKREGARRAGGHQAAEEEQRQEDEKMEKQGRLSRSVGI
jgi:hypothetical protein